MSTDSSETRKVIEMASAIVDGHASDEQIARLNVILRESTEARAAYLRIMDQHFDLDRQVARGDLSSPEDKIIAREHFVAEIRDLDIQCDARLKKLRRRKLVLGSCLVALLLILGFPYLAGLLPDANVPSVVRKFGVVELIHGDVTTTVTDEEVILPGQRLVIPDEEGSIFLRYPDGTTVDIVGPAEVQFESTSAGGKFVRLSSGYLLADVAKQASGRPLLIQTPQTTVRVLGTSLEVATVEAGTRVDLKSGHVQLQRDGDQAVALAPGELALVPPDGEEIRIQASPTALTQPSRAYIMKKPRTEVSDIAWHSDGETIIGGGRKHTTYFTTDGSISAVPVSAPDRGARFKTMNGSTIVLLEERKSRIVVWDAVTQSILHTLKAHRTDQHWTDTPATSPSGDWIVTRKQNKRVYECEIQWLSAKRRIKVKRDVRMLRFLSSPDGKLLATFHPVYGNQGDHVEVMDPKSGKKLSNIPLHDSWAVLGFSGDSRRLAIGGSGDVEVWDLEETKMLARLIDFGRRTTSVALSADGSLVAAGSPGGHIRVWRVSDGVELAAIETVESVKSIKFGPSGATLAVLERLDRVTVWEIE